MTTASEELTAIPPLSDGEDICIQISGIPNKTIREAELIIDELSRISADKAKVLRKAVAGYGARMIFIDKTADGYRLTNVYGDFRWLTLRESFMWSLFKIAPKGLIVLPKET